MTLNETVKKIMEEINKMNVMKDDLEKPLLIYLGADAQWEYGFTEGPHGLELDWAAAAKANDPLAVTFKVSDFSGRGFSAAFNMVLTARMRAEYEAITNKHDNPEKIKMLLNFFEENAGMLSPDVMSCLSNFDNPLAVMNDMTPDYGYDNEKTAETIELIENKIGGIIERNKNLDRNRQAEKRMIDGYEEKISLPAAGQHVVFAENPDAALPYLVCNIRRGSLFDAEERFNTVLTDNHTEAMREVLNRADKLLAALENDRAVPDLPPRMSELKQRLYKLELAKIGFPGAAYVPETDKIMLNPGDDRLPEIHNNGDIYFDKKYSELVGSQITPIVRMVKEVTAAWENARPAPYDSVSSYKTLAEYNGITLAARDDGEYGRGLYFVTWEDDGEAFHTGHYTDDYANAQESFAIRSGLVDKEKVITPAQATDIKAAVDFTIENCPSHDLSERLADISINLSEAFPQLSKPKEPPGQEMPEQEMTEPAKPVPVKPRGKRTLKEQLEDGKEKAREAGAQKTGPGDKAKKRDGTPEVD